MLEKQIECLTINTFTELTFQNHIIKFALK